MVRVDWWAVVVFLAIAFAGLWVAEVPVYASGGIAPNGVNLNPLFKPLTAVGMFAPAVAAVVTVVLVQRPARRGLALGVVPVQPWRRTIGWSLLGLAVPPLLGSIALAIGVLSGAVLSGTSSATLGLLLYLPVAALIAPPFAFGGALNASIDIFRLS